MSKPSLVRARENWHARYQGKKQIDVGSVFKVGRNCPLRDSTLQKCPGWSAGYFLFAAFQPSLPNCARIRPAAGFAITQAKKEFAS